MSTRSQTAILALLLLLLLPISFIGKAQAYSGELYFVCGLNPHGDNFLSLRTCGSTRCAEIMRLGPDTPLLSWEPYGTNGWRQVDVLPYPTAPQGGNYPSGWVFERYICPDRY
ncbi:hypothetical protein [uncultured Cohaesibacter sp.]|uniref:hypothetical protein n=1 Tax=uncultured Cohaesibacter sp. TaxID=1002546 RepID=UPI002930EE02|nr:hypothetical protein [uncultured Cohaesibacter sp.]